MGEEKEIRVNITDKSEDNSEQSAETSENPTQSETDNVDQTETVDQADQDETVEQEVVPEESTEDRLRKDLATAEEKLLLAMADFENYKKRQNRRQEDFYRTANDALLFGILEIIDNFERALAHAGDTDKPESLFEGTKLIHSQLVDLLKKYNVEPIVAVGEEFDPNLHEAMMQIESDEYKEGIVAIEINKGYKSGQRVLRHSRVGVSKGNADSETEKPNEE